TKFACKVIHSGGNPIIKLPDRDKVVGLPTGWTEVQVNDEVVSANFVKAFINVVRRPSSDQNVLSEVLRGWFGEHAGLPGTRFQVVLEQAPQGWRLAPVRQTEE